MAAALAESIGDAPNYQETGISFAPKPAGQVRAEFTLTVQRVDGKTPHQLRQDARGVGGPTAAEATPAGMGTGRRGGMGRSWPTTRRSAR
jgi:hypothetical protein